MDMQNLKQPKTNNIFEDFQSESIRLFEKYGLPTTKLERWKYTNLPAFELTCSSKCDVSDKKYLKPISDAADIIKKQIFSPEKQYDMSLWDMNNAYFTDGIFLDIPKNKIIDTPITIKATETGNIRTIIRVGRNSNLTIIEKNASESKTIKNHIKQIILEDGAHLTHINIQNDNKEAISLSTSHILVSSNANYNSITINMGASISKTQLQADIEGENSEVHINAINKISGKQHADITALVKHNKPNCNSSQFVRSVLDDSARAVYQGKTFVGRDACKTNAKQMSNALIISNLAEMDNKPELEIYNDDVKCSHGATCGFLDEEQLFYLRSRGIAQHDAKLILIEAFLNEIIELYPENIIKVIKENMGGS